MEWYVLLPVITLALIALLLTGMPIAFSLGILGSVGYWIHSGYNASIVSAGLLSYSIPADFVLSTIPLFILMGQFLVIGRIGADLVDFSDKWLGRLPGGLALASVGACAIFGAISGASIASVATIGLVAVPEMVKRGYDKRLAAGIVTSSAALDPIIPPSIIMIIYAVMSEQSIAKLYLGAIIPGIITMACLMLQVVFMVLRRPEIAPKAPMFTWREKFVSIKGVWMGLLLIFLVLGTLYLGIATPAEAAGLGAFGAFCITVALRRLTWRILIEVLSETAKTTAMILLILVGARIFSYYLTAMRIPQDFAQALIALKISPWVIITGMQLIWIAMGVFLEPGSIIVITTPLFVPAVVALGFSPVWFGAVLMVNMAIAMITPPMAMNIFVAAATFKDIPIGVGDITRGTLPFAIAELVALAIVVAFPVLSLWLPSMMSQVP